MPLIYRLRYSDLHRYMRRAMHAGKRGYEICGQLVLQEGHLTFVPVKNSTLDMGSFEMWYSWTIIALSKEARHGTSLVGTYHSHPASPAVPGESDISGSRSNSLMLILACCDQKAGLWRIRGGAAHRAVLCIYRG